MKKYWINQGAPNYEFWEHEFSKHGTCFSTFDVPCYGPQYVEHQEIVQFFETAILYYRRLPTWGWLDQAGIKPSNTTTYSIGQFQNALTEGYGALPYIGCSGPRYNETAAGAGSTDNGRTQISEAWYYFHVSVTDIHIECSSRLTPVAGSWSTSKRCLASYQRHWLCDQLRKSSQCPSLPTSCQWLYLGCLKRVVVITNARAWKQQTSRMRNV